MFRLNGIYRAQNIEEPMAHGKPYIRTYREYVTPAGEKVGDVIFEEYGYSEDFNGDGYYRITEILDERPVLDALNAINHYEANLRLEKVADAYWLRKIDGNEKAEEFFGKLKELGFYVESRLVNKNSEHSEKMEWFGIDTVRGITVEGTLGTGSEWFSVEFEFIFPLPSFAREMLNYTSESHGGITKTFGFGIKNELRNVSPYLPNSVKLYDFAPDIFDVIRKKLPLNLESKKFTNFKMPFVEAMEYEDHCFLEFGVTHHPLHNQRRHSQGEYIAYFKKCRKIFQNFPINVQEFLLKYTDTAQKYLTGSPWKKFINPQSDPPKNTDYHLCVKVMGVGKEGEEIAQNFMPIFEIFPEMDAKFLTFTEEMEEYIKTYDEEKKKDVPYGPFGQGMFTPLERDREPILKLFQGADLAIIFMPNTDDASVQKARFLVKCANIIGATNMVVSDKISDNILTDENADRPCEALIDYTSAYVFTDNESLTTKEAMTQIAKSILTICSEKGWHSEIDKLTTFAQMQDMIRSSEKKPIYSEIMRVHSEDAVADAANNALKELEEDIEIARVSDAFLHIETGAKTNSPSLTLQREIETIRENFSEKVKMLSCISVDTTLGEDIRVNLIIRPPDAERLCGQAYWDDLLNKNKEDDVDDTDNPYKTVFQ